ncbi:GNAT family N-acetyltransferase [Streptomyces sp. NPDC054861]
MTLHIVSRAPRTNRRSPRSTTRSRRNTSTKSPRAPSGSDSAWSPSTRPWRRSSPRTNPTPPDTDDDAHEIVAVDADGTVLGVVAVAVEEWNHRLVIRRITVDPAHRGRGIGGELMRRALAYGRDRGARTAWLEVTSVNVPAVRAYRRMGFRLCGLDTTLYTGTPSEGETALFMAKPLERP